LSGEVKKEGQMVRRLEELHSVKEEGERIRGCESEKLRR